MVRRDIDCAVEAWRISNKLPASPLSFAGPDASQLYARQYVGVIEVNDVVIEIYPKLDATFIEASDGQPLSFGGTIDSVMCNLLWMLEVGNYRDLAETATAHLEEAPTSFFDLFAYLLGKNLLPELERGVAHAYVTFEEDLKLVRGRIGLVDQVTRNWNRFDRVFCAWDEFTSDTPINRLLKCACRFLSQRVNYLETSRLLKDCEALLPDVENVTPSAALRKVADLRFDRSVDRFRTAFDLARRLLAGVGHNLGVGDTNTFVFVIDMNEVFENYVHAVLESHFNCAVETQKFVGKLLDLHKGAIAQFADYYWRGNDALWIGDAKYKHIAKRQRRSLRFDDFEDNDTENTERLAGRVLSPDDVRQLSVYAELVQSRKQLETPAKLMLLYPFVGPPEECLPDMAKAWNGSEFWLIPVQVKAQDVVGNAIRSPHIEDVAIEWPSLSAL